MESRYDPTLCNSLKKYQCLDVIIYHFIILIFIDESMFFNRTKGNEILVFTHILLNLYIGT